jgi:hypothetical protein
MDLEHLLRQLDHNVTIQVYFALKMAGISLRSLYAKSSRIRKFQRWDKECQCHHKGLPGLLGQFDYRGTPSIPPEIVLLPNWFISIFMNLPAGQRNDYGIDTVVKS